MKFLKTNTNIIVMLIIIIIYTQFWRVITYYYIYKLNTIRGDVMFMIPYLYMLSLYV